MAAVNQRSVGYEEDEEDSVGHECLFKVFTELTQNKQKKVVRTFGYLANIAPLEAS